MTNKQATTLFFLVIAVTTIFSIYRTYDRSFVSQDFEVVEYTEEELIEAGY